MAAVKLVTKGSFKNTYRFLGKISTLSLYNKLKKYGEAGVAALAKATPVDTGKTAMSWEYKIEVTGGKVIISWWNSNVVNGVPIALVIQYGHVTGTGGWVEGRDYINPAIQPIFDKMVDDVWKEVTSA